MAKLKKLISDEDTSVKNNNHAPYIINERMLDYDNNIELEELAARNDFYNNFGLSVFGQVINNHSKEIYTCYFREYKH